MGLTAGIYYLPYFSEEMLINPYAGDTGFLIKNIKSLSPLTPLESRDKGGMGETRTPLEYELWDVSSVQLL